MRWWAGLTVVLLACPEPMVMGTRGSETAKWHACVQAAVALRDNVPAYQKQFTEQFTVPHLEAGYDAYWYLTQSDGDSQHEAFVNALGRATARCEAVDVFLLAHGNAFIDWVAELPPESLQRLRLVYDTGGGDAAQGPRWVALGAKAFVGHPGSNIAPLYYVNLLPAWLSGARLEDAAAGADQAVYDGLFGKTSTTVLDLVRKMGFHPQEPKDLWAGTQSQVYGDPNLSRPAASPARAAQ
jgi:hypothetical protein